MKYTSQSIHTDFKGHHFDSILELTWYVFLTSIEKPRIKVLPQPFKAHTERLWFPDLYLSLIQREKSVSFIEAYVEIKPLMKIEFEARLNLTKYHWKEHPILIFGKSWSEIYGVHDKTSLELFLRSSFERNQNLWTIAEAEATRIGRLIGSAKGKSKREDLIIAQYGKYKGVSMFEVRRMDLGWFKWYCNKEGIYEHDYPELFL
jgi:hypothetical protein